MPGFIPESCNAYIDVLADRLSQKRSNHHVLFSVESLDGTYHHAVARGQRNARGDMMTVDSPFWIASITKMFIAVTILKLQEEKHIQLTDRIGKYIPSALLKDLLVVKGTDHGGMLTVDHLLKHASGLPDYLELKLDGRKTLIDNVLETGDRSWSLEDILSMVKEAHNPLWEPQDLSKSRYRVRYSDTNYQILIEIIKVVSGMSLGNAFEHYIFKPLGLKHTHLPVGDHETDVATTWLGDQVFEHKPLAFASFNDLVSTLSDLTLFMRNLIQGNIFASEESVALMVSQWQTFGFGMSLLAPGWPIQYGRGVMRFRMPKFFTGFKELPSVIGHTGATGSWLFYCEEYQLIFAGTVSQVTSAPVPFSVIPKLLGVLGKETGKNR